MHMNQKNHNTVDAVDYTEGIDSQASPILYVIGTPVSEYARSPRPAAARTARGFVAGGNRIPIHQAEEGRRPLFLIDRSPI